MGDGGRAERELGERLFDRVGRALAGKGTVPQYRDQRGCDDYQGSEFHQESRQERNPEMQQTRKGKQQYFGMKADAGAARPS